MKLFKKKRGRKDINEIINDIMKSFKIIINEGKKRNFEFYHIVIKKTRAKHDRDLNFILTNKLFNTMNKFNNTIIDGINYIFVVEYSKVNSLGLRVTNDLGMHAHIFMSTCFSDDYLLNEIKSVFPESEDIFFENITKNNDIDSLSGYFCKQKQFLRDEGYNYKINVT